MDKEARLAEQHRIGIVGCGRWGRNVIRTLVELKTKYPLDILGVVNTGKAENADFVRSQFGLACEAKLSKLLDGRPDALFIVTPDETHFGIAKQALDRGIAVFVEKPVALTLSETRQLIEISKRKKAGLSTGHLLVFHPCVRLIQDWLHRTGQEPLSIFSNRLAQIAMTQGRTVLRSSLVHDLSMVDVFLKKIPSAATCRSFFKPMPDSEYVDVFLDFPGGAKAHLIGSSVWPEPERTFALWTQDTYFHMDGVKNSIKVFRKKSAGSDYALEHEETPKGQPLYFELENFIQSLSDPSKLTIDADHILRVMSAIDMIER